MKNLFLKEKLNLLNEIYDITLEWHKKHSGEQISGIDDLLKMREKIIDRINVIDNEPGLEPDACLREFKTDFCEVIFKIQEIDKSIQKNIIQNKEKLVMELRSINGCKKALKAYKPLNGFNSKYINLNE